MSILINMEMPISCERCPMLDWDLDYIKCKVTDRHFKMTECWRSIRVPDCPLVSVPPHGDLIDRDALLDTATIHWSQTTNESCFPIDEIEYAPTIIPASKEGE